MTAATELHAAVSRLVLWRHGRTEWNATGRFQGQLDPPLDDEGRRQATAGARHLAAALQLTADDAVVVSSDLRRAAETAAALTHLIGVPLRTDPRIREHSMGAWEGLDRDEVAARYPEQYAAWMAGRPVLGRGGEEPAAVMSRAMALIRALPPARVAILVTHGGTSGRLLEALLELAPDHRRMFGPLGNCCWSELARQDGRWRLLRHNCGVVAPAGPARPGELAGGSVTQDGPTPEEAPPPQDADAVS